MVLNKWLSPTSGTSSTHGMEGIKARGKPRTRLSFAPEMEMKSALPILLLLLVALTCNQVDAAANRGSSQSENEFATKPSNVARKHKHQLLLFLGGLKSLAAVILIKIKIVLVVAAIIAVSMFTVKYLVGATALPDLPFLHNKANLVPQPLPLSPPSGPAYHYLPVEHEPVYGTHDYSAPTIWDHNNHDNFANEWSKIGNGGRSLLDFANNLDLEKISLKNAFNNKRKKIRRRR